MRPVRILQTIPSSALACLVLLGCARPPKRPMENMGPWAVGFRTATAVDAARGGRRVPMAVWYPVEPSQARGRRASYVFYRHPLITLRLRSDSAVCEAPIAKAQAWPLIVFSHASPSVEGQSPNYVETLASRGFVVVAPHHVGDTLLDKGRIDELPMEPDRFPDIGKANARDPYEITLAARRGEPWALDLVGDKAPSHLYRPFDIWLAIDWAAEQARSPASFLYDAVDPTRTGVTGHSGGGWTCVAAAAGYNGVPPDPRIKAVVLAAPAGLSLIPDEVLRSVTAPVLFVVGGQDEGAPWGQEGGRASRLMASRSIVAATVRGAGHAHFADIDSFAYALKRLGLYPWTWRGFGGGRLVRIYRNLHTKGAISPYDSHRLLGKYAAAFFELHLKGDQGAAVILDPAQPHDPAVELRILRR